MNGATTDFRVRSSHVWLSPAIDFDGPALVRRAQAVGQAWGQEAARLRRGPTGTPRFINDIEDRIVSPARRRRVERGKTNSNDAISAEQRPAALLQSARRQFAIACHANSRSFVSSYLPLIRAVEGSISHKYRKLGRRERSSPGILMGTILSCSGTFGVVE